jgi:hypothetical protein
VIGINPVNLKLNFRNIESMLKEVKIVTYVHATVQLIFMIACQKRKEHKLSTDVCEIKVQQLMSSIVQKEIQYTTIGL